MPSESLAFICIVLLEASTKESIEEGLINKGLFYRPEKGVKEQLKRILSALTDVKVMLLDYY